VSPITVPPGTGNLGRRTSENPTIIGCCRNWGFIHKKIIPTPGDGEIPTRKLTWKPLGWLRHIKCRTIDDSFPLSFWEVWFYSRLSVPIPVLIGPSNQCVCNTFLYDSYDHHLQTCQTKSVVPQVHEWVVYKLGVLLDSVGHKVKIHKITSVTGKERGDIEMRDYVVLQKNQEQDNLLDPPHTLILDFNMTHTCYDRSIQHTTGQLTHTMCSDGAPEIDGALKNRDNGEGTGLEDGGVSQRISRGGVPITNGPENLKDL
jgi:hypothetical protein